MRGIRQLFTLVMVLALMISCGRARHQRQMAVLHLADSLSNDYPARAYDSLMADTALFRDAGKAIRMRYLLTMANAQNKAAVPFRNDSIMKIVTDYYDSHGSANEVMTAHYLLGCVYRDLGEAPEALECFNDAVEKADTADDDCDYLLLSHIYAQRGDIFRIQQMDNNSVADFRNAYLYALKAKDTLTAINNYEQQTTYFETVGKLDSAAFISEHSSALYDKYGDKESAARALAFAIYKCTIDNELPKAKRFLDKYLSNSAIYNADGSIKQSCLYAYYYKGLYYLYDNNIDSAKVCFYSLLNKSDECGDEQGACEGLFKMYKKIGIADSALKYSELLLSLSDSVQHQLSSAKMQQIQSMYNYQRSENLANIRSKQLERVRLLVVVASFAFIMLITVISFLYYRYRQKKEREMESLKNKYERASAQLEKAQSELSLLKKSSSINAQSLKERQEEIERLHIEIQGLRHRMKNEGRVKENDIQNESIVLKLHEQASHGKSLTDEDISEFQSLMNSEMPDFVSQLKHLCVEKESDLLLCEFIRLHFNLSELIVLFDKKPSAVTNWRARMLKRMFNIDGSVTLFDEKIRAL